MTIQALVVSQIMAPLAHAAPADQATLRQRGADTTKMRRQLEAGLEEARRPQLQQEEPPTLEAAMDRWFRPTASRADEAALQEWLIGRGAEELHVFVERVRQQLGDLTPEAFGAYRVPPFDPDQLPAPGQMSGSYPIPSAAHEFEAERVRIMAHAAVRRAYGHLRHRPVTIVSNVGMGHVGTAVSIVTAEAEGFDVIAFQRPSRASSQKVNLVNQGQMPVQTADPSAPQRLREAVEQGKLTATFLMEALAVADFIMLETEVHLRKTQPKAVNFAKASAEETIALLRHMAPVMQRDATVLVESTVPPGFTEGIIWPTLTSLLRDPAVRGDQPRLADDQSANVAYAFQRLQPGPRWLQSLLEQKRIGAAMTAKARADLSRYFQAVGFRSEIWSDVAAVEALKDIENAYNLGMIEVMGGFLRGIEILGGNAWVLMAEIAARGDRHAAAAYAPAIQEGQGYCTPKELGELLAGLKQHYGTSDPEIMRIFRTRIDAVAIADHRAQDYAYWLMGPLGDLGLTLADSAVLVAGASYKPGVGDTRWTGAERLIRLLAHYGATVAAADPYVDHWPEFQGQHPLDPESWAYGLANQAPLQQLRLQTVPTLYEALHPHLDAVVLATRHAEYLGRHQLEFLRRLDPDNLIHRQWRRMFEDQDFDALRRESGLDAVKATARVLGGRGRIIVDTFNFLHDEDIKEWLALGWTVLGSGKGHLTRLASEITPAARLALHERLLAELDAVRGVSGISEADRQRARAAVQAEIAVLRVEQQAGLEEAESVELLRARAAAAQAALAVALAKPAQRAYVEASLTVHEAKVRYLETVEGVAGHGDSQWLHEQLEQAEARLQAARTVRDTQVLDRYVHDIVVPTWRQVQTILEAASAELGALGGIPVAGFRPPAAARDVATLIQQIAELRDRTASLRLYADALAVEMLSPEGQQRYWQGIQERQARPDLAMPPPRTDLGGAVLMPDTIPLFPGTYPVGDERRGAPYYARGANGRLHYVERHPWNSPFNSLTLKMVPDMAVEDPATLPQAWGRFSIWTPLNAAAAVGPDGEALITGFQAYPGLFDRLPPRFRQWFLQEMLGRGLVPTTMNGQRQDAVDLIMQVNLQTTTPARGRGGLWVDRATREPLWFTSSDGFEFLLDIKALGPYGGGDPTTLEYNGDRVISGGFKEGKVEKSRLGQLLGFQEDWSEVNNLWELAGTEAWQKGWATRPVFLLRFQFAGNPEFTMAMVGRAVPTNERLGQSHIGQPEVVAQAVGWNAAEILHYPMAAVHIALIADNIMTGDPDSGRPPYVTDQGSLIWLQNERDPFGALLKYGGWAMQVPLFPFTAMKTEDFSHPRGEFLAPWIRGFRERFLDSPLGRQRVKNPRRFTALLNPKNRQARTDPNAYIKALLSTLWHQYLPWELLKERLERGYDPTRESSYTQTSGTTYLAEFQPLLIKDRQDREWGILGPEQLGQIEATGRMRVQILGTDQEREVMPEQFYEETGKTVDDVRRLPEDAARRFIRDQRELLQIAERLIAEEGYPTLPVDFARAYRLLDAKDTAIRPNQPSYTDVYDLHDDQGRLYPERKPLVIPVIGNVADTARGDAPITVAHVDLMASEMSEKVGVENVVVGRRGGRAKTSQDDRRAAGLEEPAETAEAPTLAQWQAALQDPDRGLEIMRQVYPPEAALEKLPLWQGWMRTVAAARAAEGAHGTRQPAFDPALPMTVAWTPGRAALPLGGRHVDYIGFMGGSLGFPILQGVAVFLQEAEGLNGAVEVYGLGSPLPAVMAAYPGGRPRSFSLAESWMQPPTNVTTVPQWDTWAKGGIGPRIAAQSKDGVEDHTLNYADGLVAGAMAFLRTPLGDSSGRARASLDRMVAEGKGLRIAVVGDLTPGGQSTSSAIVLGITQALSRQYGWGLSTDQMVNVGYAERVWAGTQGGVKDHATMMNPPAFLGVSPVRVIQPLSMPNNVQLLALDTGISRDRAQELSPKLQQPEHAEAQIKGRTGIGYALGVLWLRQHHPELREALGPYNDPANPYGLGRELLPGGRAGLSSVQLLQLLREIPEDGLTREQLEQALPDFANELGTLFERVPALPQGVEPAPYRVREMLQFGFTEEARSLLTAQVLQQMGAGAITEDKALDQLIGIAKAAHHGDRVVQHRITLNQEGRVVELQETAWNARTSNALLDEQMARGEAFTLEDLALGRAGYGHLERSLEPIDLLVDLIEVFNQGHPVVREAHRGTAAAGVIVGAGLGGTVTVLVRPEYAQPLQEFLQREYYDRLALAPQPPIMIEPGNPSTVLALSPMASPAAGLEERAGPAVAERIRLTPGVTTDHVIFLAPDVATADVIAAFSAFEPPPGETAGLVVFAYGQNHKEQIEKYLRQSGIQLREPVVSQTDFPNSTLEELLQTRRRKYETGPSQTSVLIVRWSDDLRKLGTFWQIPPERFQQWLRRAAPSAVDVAA